MNVDDGATNPEIGIGPRTAMLNVFVSILFKFCKVSGFKTNTSSAQNVYNRRKAGISTAIALSVLIPFVIIAGCFLVRMREVVQERGGGQRIEQRNEPKVRNRLSSDPKLQTQNINDNDQNGIGGGEVARKNSKHEGTYYTNEPLDYYTRN